MCVDGPPDGLQPSQWAPFLERAAAFLRTWGASAAALGWTADDLLSFDPAAWLRFDRRGALLLLQADSTVIGLTADELVVRKDRAVFHLRRRSAP